MALLARRPRRPVPVAPSGYTFGVDELGQPATLEVGPHALIAGITGSGKSVTTRAILVSASADPELGLVGFDPKRVELAPFRPRFATVSTDDRAHTLLASSLVELMDVRYRLLEAAGLVEWTPELHAGPRVLVVLAELSALMATTLDPLAAEDLRDALRTAKTDAEVRTLQIRLLGQQARAAGIQLLCDTQRPSADNIDGDFRSNMSARLCLYVRNAYTAEMVLGDLAEGGPRPWEELSLAHPGVGFYDNGRSDHLRRVRSTFYTVDQARHVAATTAPLGRRLGTVNDWTAQALEALDRYDRKAG